MRAEQSLLRSLGRTAHQRQQLFGSLIRNTPGISFRCIPDEDGTIVFISDAVESMTGWPAKDFIEGTKFFRDIIHPEDYPRFAAEEIRAIAENRSMQRELRMLHRDGRAFWVWSQACAVYDAQDRVTSVDGVIIDISERKSIELALRASEQLTSSLMRNMPGVAVRVQLDADYTIVFVSAAIEKLTGWPAIEFITRRKTLIELLHPDDRARTLEAASRALAAEGAYSIEYRLIRRSGATAWILSHGSFVLDAQKQPLWLDSVLTDITDRKTTELALRESEQLTASLMRNIPGVSARSLLNERRTTVFVSHAVEKLTGWPPAEFMARGRTLRSLVHPDDSALVHAQVSAGIKVGGAFSIEFRMLRRDGSFVWVWAHGSMVVDAEHRQRWIDTVIIDISERHAMEADLRDAKEQAERAAASKAGFLADVGHQIHLPVNAIIGFSDLLLGTTLDAAQRRHVGAVHASARSLLCLLDDVLDTADPEKSALEYKVADPAQTVLAFEMAEPLQPDQPIPKG